MVTENHTSIEWEIIINRIASPVEVFNDDTLSLLQNSDSERKEDDVETIFNKN